MTAQSTTQPAISGTRIAPMIVVIIAILAFGAGLALAQVIAPAARSAAVPASAPALTFDAPLFRAQERAASATVAAPFDAPLFRAQERAATLPLTVAAPVIGGNVAGNDGRHDAVGVTTVGDSLARDAGRHR